MYRLIAVDLDGTLLDDKNRVSAVNIRALKDARDAGIYILPVTGRAYRCIAPIMDELGLADNYVVGMSGSDIRRYPSGESVHNSCLTSGEVARMYEFSKEYRLILQAVRLDGSYYFSHKNEYTDSYAKYFGYDGQVADLSTLPYDDICKCMLMFEEERMGEITAAARRDLPASVRVEPIWSIIIDLYATGGDKASALRYVANEIGIPMGEVVAIGDEVVDIPMLEAAGLGIAMGNANDELKSRADFIVGDNLSNGVAEAVYKYILTQT